MHGWFTVSLCGSLCVLVLVSRSERSPLVRRDRVLRALVPPLRAVYVCSRQTDMCSGAVTDFAHSLRLLVLRVCDMPVLCVLW